MKNASVRGYKKTTSSIRCLHCGCPVHWTSVICEKCRSNPFKERRVAPRTNFRKTFLYDGFVATVHNMSAGGVQIKTQTPLPVGEEFRIAFSLGDGMAQFDGTVIYTQSLSKGNSLAGLRFVNLPTRETERLQCFLDSHGKRLTTPPETSFAHGIFGR
jgi:hypothetical protein